MQESSCDVFYVDFSYLSLKLLQTALRERNCLENRGGSSVLRYRGHFKETLSFGFCLHGEVAETSVVKQHLSSSCEKEYFPLRHLISSPFGNVPSTFLSCKMLYVMCMTFEFIVAL